MRDLLLVKRFLPRLGQRAHCRQECCLLRARKPSLSFSDVLFANVAGRRGVSRTSSLPLAPVLSALCKFFPCWLRGLSIGEIPSGPAGWSESCSLIWLVSQLLRHLKFLSITRFYWNLLLRSASQNRDFTKKIINSWLILFAW